MKDGETLRAILIYSPAAKLDRCEPTKKIVVVQKFIVYICC